MVCSPEGIADCSKYNKGIAGSGDEMEIRLPDETQSSTPGADLTARLSSMAGGGTDLSSRLSSMAGQDMPVTPSKDNYSISEFLTKIAHGEKLDVSSFIGGGRDVDRKRRRLSGEGYGGGGYDPATGGMFDTPAPRSKNPWSEEPEPVPDWLSRVRLLFGLIVQLSYVTLAL